MLPLATSFSALLDEESRSWNVDLIKQEFLSHEAKLILGIPLSDRVIPDKFVWLPSPNGNYTTCSAYRLLSRVTRNLQPSCSTQEKNHFLWTVFGIFKCLIDLNTCFSEHVIMHYQLCNLWRRNVVSFTTCPGCNFGHDDTIHALCYCCSLLVVWKDDAILMKLLRYDFLCFADLLGMMSTTRDLINTDLLALTF